MFSDKGTTVGLPRRWSSTKTGMDTSWDVTPRIDEAACLDDTGQKTYKSPPHPPKSAVLCRQSSLCLG